MVSTPQPEQPPVDSQDKDISSTLVSKNITVNGRRTSVRLEPAMWNCLTEIHRRERTTIHMICSAIAELRPEGTSLTAAIRVFIMSYFHAAATEEGHVKSGHGQGPAATAIQLLVQSVLDPTSMTYPLPSPYMIGKAYVPTKTERTSNVTPFQNGQRLPFVSKPFTSR